MQLNSRAKIKVSGDTGDENSGEARDIANDV
jgi:hypothetical protein